MYDKFGLLLRVETTANSVFFFKHHRMVEHRNQTRQMKPLSRNPSTVFLPSFGFMSAANQRYLRFISAVEDPTSSLCLWEKISRPGLDAKRTYRGFNLFNGEDLGLTRAINGDEFTWIDQEGRRVYRYSLTSLGEESPSRHTSCKTCPLFPIRSF